MYVSGLVLKKIEENVADLLMANQTQMNKTYEKGGGALSIDIKAGVQQEGARIKITTAISFVTGRCKDARKGYVDEQQSDLFNEKEG